MRARSATLSCSPAPLIGCLLLLAPAAMAADGVGLYGRTDDKVVTYCRVRGDGVLRDHRDRRLADPGAARQPQGARRAKSSSASGAPKRRREPPRAMPKTSYERSGAAAVLTITRPERRNAVDDETAAELLDGLSPLRGRRRGARPGAHRRGARGVLRRRRPEGVRRAREAFLAEHPDGGSRRSASGDRRGSTSAPTARSGSPGCGPRSRRSRRSPAGRSRAGSSSPSGATCGSRPRTPASASPSGASACR